MNKTKRSRRTVIENKPVVMHWGKGSTRIAEWEVQTAGCKMDFKGVLYHVGNIAYIVISVDGV